MARSRAAPGCRLALLAETSPGHFTTDRMVLRYAELYARISPHGRLRDSSDAA